MGIVGSHDRHPLVSQECAARPLVSQECAARPLILQESAAQHPFQVCNHVLDETCMAQEGRWKQAFEPTNEPCVDFATFSNDESIMNNDEPMSNDSSVTVVA